MASVGQPENPEKSKLAEVFEWIPRGRLKSPLVIHGSLSFTLFAKRLKSD